MGRGKRYDDEPKLNLKKVFGTIIILAVIIMSIITINNILNRKAEEINAEKVTYFSMYLDEKWGIINSKGETVIDATYDEILVVPNPEKAIFVCAYNVDNETESYKTKVINDKKEEQFTEYERVEAIENFDSKHNVWFEKNVLRVYKNGKYGLIELDGKKVLDAEYDEITALKTY